ncbi:hypothetical protein DB032_23280 [Chromobacterium sp. Panama]|uniref:hypothetical protein n=1 Tax=Chromobacterium sp. Panama TaxID=2161826 RepID=UPI000D30E3C1|nr:hypothetical protein [Chromobacterium sp. Panama]PTU67633.1 hypothetical protein DB032_23280 [Chromobacterium sp. Panama]
MIDRHRLERLGRHLMMICLIALTPLAYTGAIHPIISLGAPAGLQYLYYAIGLALALLVPAPLLAYLLASRFPQDWQVLSLCWRAWAIPTSIALAWLLKPYLLPSHPKSGLLLSVGLFITPAAQLLLLLLHKLILRFGFWAASGLGLFLLLWAVVI